MTTPLTTLGITAADITAYLEANGVPKGLCRRGEGVEDAEALASGVDAMVVISRSIRPGWLTEERALQWAAFHFRCVGVQGVYDSAELLAFQVDRILVRVESPVTMGSVRVSAVQDLGSGPTLLPQKDDSRRAHFTASYAFSVPSGLS